MRVDRKLPIPLYHQIAEILRRVIQEKNLQPGDLLTKEEEVEECFGVSRATARRALEELVDEGLVVRITGKGTYVERPKVQPQLPNMLSFTEEIIRFGMTPSSSVIEAKIVEPPEEAAAHLELPEGEEVLRLERVRHADGEPIVYMVDYLPAWLNLDPETDFGGSQGSLYALLESAGKQIDEAEHVIESGLVDEPVAGHLGVPAGSPALRFWRTTYDVHGRPIVYEESVCRGDLYRYAVRLKRGYKEDEEATTGKENLCMALPIERIEGRGKEE